MKTTRNANLGTEDGKLYGATLFARGTRAVENPTGISYHTIALSAWEASDAGLTYAARSEYLQAFKTAIHETLTKLAAA